jgi:hypothetical protein
MAESGSYPMGGMDEYGQTSPGINALREALGRITRSLPAGSSRANGFLETVTPTSGPFTYVS